MSKVELAMSTERKCGKVKVGLRTELKFRLTWPRPPGGDITQNHEKKKCYPSVDIYLLHKRQ